MHTQSKDMNSNQINLKDLETKLKQFLTTYNYDGKDMQSASKKPYYISQMNSFGEKLSVDCSHIYHFDNSVYNHINDNPLDAIKVFEQVAT